VRSGSSKRSSTGDFSSELDDYFDNVAHRSLQTAVIEEETTPAELASVHDACAGPSHPEPTGAALASRRVVRMTGQNSLEHFVDNLINEAAQQSKTEIEQYLVVHSTVAEGPSGTGGDIFSVERGSTCTPLLEQYASILATDIVTGALEEVAVNEKRRSSDFVRPSRHPAIQRQLTEQHPTQHGRRFERQQTVSGFRDAVLSDFDQKLINSNIATAALAVTFAYTAGSQKRRSSEPANLNYIKNSHGQRAVSPPTLASTSSSVDCRRVISSWFAPLVDHSVSDALSDYVQNLVVDAFAESVSPSSKSVHRRHRRRHRKTSQPQNAVPDAISLYADYLTGCIMTAVHHQLRMSSAVFSGAQSVSLHAVAETFAQSIVDDALAVQSTSVSSSSQHRLVSSV